MSRGASWCWRTKPSPVARSRSRSRTGPGRARPRCSWSHRRSTRAPRAGARRRTPGGPRPRVGSTRPSRPLVAAGVDAHGEVGDADPLKAIDQALRTFPRRRGPDRDATRTGSRTGSDRDVVASARERFPVPVAHVVVDLEHERARAREPGSSSLRSTLRRSRRSPRSAPWRACLRRPASPPHRSSRS